MKSTNNYDNIKGLAIQATRKWKADHILYETKKGNWTFSLYKNKKHGELISYKEIVKEDKKLLKEEAATSVNMDKPKKSKAVSEL